jgi:hypothetical protein
MTGGATGEVPAWCAQLPADLRDNKQFHAFKTIGDMGKNFLEVSTKAGEVDALKTKLNDYIPKLVPTSTPDEVAVYRLQIGVPKTADEYAFTGENLIADRVSAAKQFMHKRGIPKEAAEGLFQDYLALEKSTFDAEVTRRTNERTEAEKKQKAEWGAKYQEIVNGISRVWKTMFPNGEFDRLVNETKTIDGVALGNHPLFLAMMNAFRVKFGEDHSPAGRSGETGAGDKGMINLYK